jgi:hypothetical protein
MCRRKPAATVNGERERHRIELSFPRAFRDSMGTDD